MRMAAPEAPPAAAAPSAGPWQERAARGGGLGPRATVLLAVLAPVPILAYDVVRGGWSTTLAVVVAWAAGMLLFRGRGLPYFHLALLANVTAILLLAAQFMRENGDPFASGGDDRNYHALSQSLGQSWAVGDWGAVQHYLYYDSLGFIALGALLHIVTTYLGDVNPLTIRVLGSFAGATLAPAAYLISRELFGARDARLPARTALCVALFPLLTYYAAMGLRDIWVAAATTWFVFAQMRVQRAPVRAWAACAGLAAVIFLLRPASLAPVFVFAAVMQLGRARSYAAMLVQGTMLTGGLAVVAVSWSELMDRMGDLTLMYRELATEQAAIGSLGVRLLALPEPVGSVARFLYTVYIPVPPVTGSGPAELIPGLGAAAWYLAVPLVIAGVWIAARRRESRLPALASAALMMALLVGISLTSIDVRHKTPMFPLALVFATLALRVVPPPLLKTWGILYGCIMGVLAGLYLLIK